jgi:hypothetical protein
VLEREAAMKAVAEVLDSTFRGAGRVLFVVGEAGLGKTSILEAAVERAGERFRVAVGRGGVAEAGMPFGVMTDVLVQLLGEQVLDGLTEAAGSVGPVAATRLYAILNRIRRVADQSAVLIALDDLTGPTRTRWPCSTCCAHGWLGCPSPSSPPPVRGRSLPS